MSKAIQQVVELDQNYSIHTDSMCTTLKYELEYDGTVKGKPKKITSRDEWYYPDMKGAMKAYLQKSLRHADGLQGVLDKMQQVEDLINLKFR